MPKSPIEQTQTWVEKMVIGHNLCPFARPVIEAKGLRYVLCESDNKEDLLNLLIEELTWLAKEDIIETTLIVHPYVLLDFESYWDFVGMTDVLLQQLDLEGIIQIADFHPDYCFQDANFDDPANFSNRSPFPMLHLLKEESLDEAIDQHPNTHLIPERNIKRLRNLGLVQVEAILNEIKT